MTRIIGVISGKGGVGKTTTVANLGSALVQMGKDVIILDANVTTPNLSLHLGIPFYKTTLHDVLREDSNIYRAVYRHRSGLKIIPASLSVGAMKDVKIERIQSALLNLLGGADIILLDAAAGLGREARATIDVADELIIVTNPDLPSVTDALKTIKIAEEGGTAVLGVVVNRVSGRSYELSNREIEEMLEVPVLVNVPEDVAVPQSIAVKMPVVNYKPRSKAAREFKRLAGIVSGETFIESAKEKNFVERLFGWLS